MCDKIKFKIINMYGLTTLKNPKGNYYVVSCDPSYGGDPILWCTKSELSFDEVILILKKKHRKVFLIGAISFIYYYYSKQFFEFVQECDEDIYKIVKKKCFSHFKRLFNFIKISDDILYPQNENIRKIYYFMKDN